jgi:hypothetical protein
LAAPNLGFDEGLREVWLKMLQKIKHFAHFWVFFPIYPGF